jgi:hypothetical protein
VLPAQYLTAAVKSMTFRLGVTSNDHSKDSSDIVLQNNPLPKRRCRALTVVSLRCAESTSNDSAGRVPTIHQRARIQY